MPSHGRGRPALRDGKSPVGIFRTAWMTVLIGPPPLARTIRTASSFTPFFLATTFPSPGSFLLLAMSPSADWPSFAVRRQGADVGHVLNERPNAEIGAKPACLMRAYEQSSTCLTAASVPILFDRSRNGRVTRNGPPVPLSALRQAVGSISGF